MSESLGFFKFIDDEKKVCPKCCSIVDTTIPLTASGVICWACEKCGHTFHEKYDQSYEEIREWMKKKYKVVYYNNYGKVVMYEDSSP